MHSEYINKYLLKYFMQSSVEFKKTKKNKTDKNCKEKNKKTSEQLNITLKSILISCKLHTKEIIYR